MSLSLQGNNLCTIERVSNETVLDKENRGEKKRFSSFRFGLTRGPESSTFRGGWMADDGGGWGLIAYN